MRGCREHLWPESSDWSDSGRLLIHWAYKRPSLHLSDECKAVNHQAQIKNYFLFTHWGVIVIISTFKFVYVNVLFLINVVSLCGPTTLCDITVPENRVVFIQISCSVTSALYSFSCRGLSVRCIQAPSEMLKSCAKKRHPHVQLLNFGNKIK